MVIKYFVSYSYFVDGLMKNGNAEFSLKRKIEKLSDIEELQKMLEEDSIVRYKGLVKNSLKIINFIKL